MAADTLHTVDVAVLCFAPFNCCCCRNRTSLERKKERERARDLLQLTGTRCCFGTDCAGARSTGSRNNRGEKEKASERAPMLQQQAQAEVAIALCTALCVGCATFLERRRARALVHLPLFLAGEGAMFVQVNVRAPETDERAREQRESE